MIDAVAWIIVLAASTVAAWLTTTTASPAFLESWLVALLLWSSLGIGALGLLMTAHLFGERWLAPVRTELDAAARTLPVSAILFAPVLLNLPELYPWARDPESLQLTQPQRLYLEPDFFRLRVIAYVVVWSLLAIWITRMGRHRVISAFGLLMLFMTFVFADLDVIRSRELAWWAQLEGIAHGVALLLGTLAVAMIATLLEGTSVRSERLEALTRTLLVLALLTIWLWSIQFLIVWSANVPEEVAWYRVRTDWGEPLLGVAPGRLVTGAILLALLGGSLLAALPNPSRGRLFTAGALLFAQHAGQVFWLVRPAALSRPSPLQDILAIVGIGVLWMAAGFITLRRQREREAVHAESELAR